MIRTNLSTRPFYDDRAVNIWLLVIAALVAAATAFNVNRVLHYSRSDTQLGVAASRDEGRAADLLASATRLRGSMDPKQIDRVSDEARRANDLIDQRTFSWTELFNRFEKTLPDDVRITSVRPRVDRRHGTVIAITVVARDVKDVNQFIENLEATRAFTNVLSHEEHVTEDGQLTATLEGGYSGAVPAPTVQPASEPPTEARR